jgi:ribosomal protein S18 acetylase RimI-like enzyme
MRLEHLDGAGTIQKLGEIQTVYAAAFPEYDLGDHEYRTRRQATSPGFEAVLAWDDDVLAGIVYGLPLAAWSTWWTDIDPPKPADFTTETGTRTLAVIDLAVLPSHRGQGVAHRLMDELLAGREEERATLAAAPHEKDVQAMYERWGWRKAGSIPGSEDETEPWFDLYVIDLHPSSGVSNSR